jgi:hypothetical protein
MDSNKQSNCERFVADGDERLASSHGYQEAAAAARKRVYAKLASQIAAAGPLRRLWLCYLRHRELSRELDRLAPPEALYARAGGA